MKKKKGTCVLKLLALNFWLARRQLYICNHSPPPRHTVIKHFRHFNSKRNLRSSKLFCNWKRKTNDHLAVTSNVKNGINSWTFKLRTVKLVAVTANTMFSELCKSLYLFQLVVREEGKDTRLCYLPVMLSQRIRDVMIRPKGVKSPSKSCCVMDLGRPLT